MTTPRADTPPNTQPSTQPNIHIPHLPARQPATTRPGLLFTMGRAASRIILKLIYRAQAIDVHHVPTHGPLLIAANHQSYLDPPLVGIFVTRELNFVARSGLFTFKPFAWLILRLNSIPLREEAGDVAAIKEILRRLDAGGAVVIFPEGSRSTDGSIGPFKRGVALLVKRAGCPVVPAAVEGCFDAWPRGRWPSLFGKRLAVKYAPPIPHAELMKNGPDAALERLPSTIDSLRLDLRQHLRHNTQGRYPKPGPGDRPRAPGA
ncbi:MAG TPA: lysophospholipid acyltransferase family protein [Phycisphaerales bacterium]|nr:lysophospholipid acyltransferase family protein [Phycisphaerales bacterium]